ncbi:hypothetical protein D3C72_310100 [compost metagenome]
MDITNQITNYINSQNQKIWNELEPNYLFRFIYNPLEYSWTGRTDGAIATITTPNTKIDYESFTHELLHVYLDYLGLSPYPELIYSIRGESSMGILVVKSDLILHLYNFCSHKKMYPIYKEMGFSEYNFVDQRITFNQNDLDCIKNGFLSNGKQSKYIHQFIGHSLSLMNNVVDEDKEKCQNFLEEMKLLNPELFQIVEDFDTSWNNSIDLNLTEVFLPFEERLENWLVKNNLTFENHYCRQQLTFA